MRTRLLFFLVISAIMMLLVSCGEETNSETPDQQVKGTVLNRDFVRRNDFGRMTPVLKMKKLPPVNMQNWAQIATGQDQCYQNAVQVDCSEVSGVYAGQDGASKRGTRSLVKESNEIIKDEVTSLLWTKYFKENVTWYEAKLYCDSLKIGGSTRVWRLPTTAELRTLVNYGRLSPAMDPVFYENENAEFKKSLSNWFWASKNVRYNSDVLTSDDKVQPASAWIINFKDGFVEYTSRYNTYNVRCVTER